MPGISLGFERYVDNSRVIFEQRINEPVVSCLSDLKEMSKMCAKITANIKETTRDIEDTIDVDPDSLTRYGDFASVWRQFKSIKYSGTGFSVGLTEFTSSSNPSQYSTTVQQALSSVQKGIKTTDELCHQFESLLRTCHLVNTGDPTDRDNPFGLLIFKAREISLSLEILCAKLYIVAMDLETILQMLK